MKSLSFKEFDSILESFELQAKPVNITLAETKKNLFDYLIQKYITKEKTEIVLNNMLNSYSSFRAIVDTINGTKYIFFILKTKDIFEAHFNEFSKVDYFEDTSSSNNSINVFGKLFNYVYWYIISKGNSVKIKSPNVERTELYSKIIKKIISKHSINYKVSTFKDEIFLEALYEKFTEKYKG